MYEITIQHKEGAILFDSRLPFIPQIGSVIYIRPAGFARVMLTPFHGKKVKVTNVELYLDASGFESAVVLVDNFDEEAEYAQ